jgi:transglutaminase-like putative cysteine protease
MATALAPPRTQVNEGLSTAFLLALLLISLTGSVAAVGWVDGLGILIWPALGGMLLGTVLAKLPVRGWLAHGLTILFAFAASVAFPLLLLTEPAGNRAKLFFLLTHLRDWTIKVLRGGTASDNLIFVVQLVFFAWLFAQISAWFIFRRHQVWGAVVLIGSALLLNLFYAPDQSGVYLVLFLFGSLLLLVRMNLNAMERRWRESSIGYATDIIFDFFQYGVIFSLMFLSVAWILPDTAPGAGTIGVFDWFQEPWQDLEDQFTRAFSSVKPVERRVAGLSSGTSLVMGGPIKLTDHPVIDIQSNTGRYWRAALYEHYTGSAWLSAHNDLVSLTWGDPRIGARPDELRTIVTQTIQVRAPDPGNTLYAASQPVQFDLPVEIRYSKANSDKGTFGFDLASARSRRPLRDNDTYTVVSALTRADEQSLRTVGSNFNYPSWFTDDYLQLPDRMPARVSTLAKAITQGQMDQFDKAMAIEQYLRNSIKYNEAVAQPPSGRDAVDYLLFERPEGYCNYYASAMAVLARIVGIPARVASGYSQGDYQNGTYHILERDAHAWPELYFPGYGWIEFEPTANKPEIDRPKKPDSGQGNPNDADSLESRQRGNERNTEIPDDETGANGGSIGLLLPWGDPFNIALTVLGGVAAVGALGLVAAQLSHSRRLAHLPPAARTYEEMLTRASWLGVPDGVYRTPFERADALANKMPTARPAIERIASLYARERFGVWKTRMTERAMLAADWDKVRGATWGALGVRILAFLRSLPPAIQLQLARILNRLRL